MDRRAFTRWQRRAAVAVIAVWAGVSLARVTLLVESPRLLTGEEVEPIAAFAQSVIPSDEKFLWVDTIEFGPERGTAPRLAYELYPRREFDIGGLKTEQEVKDTMREHGIRFVVVTYAPYYGGHWITKNPSGFKRFELDPDRYVLELVSE